MSEEKCFYCDKPATRFCDFAIGGPIGAYERVGPIEKATFRACFTIQPFYKCDMPMCDDHKKEVGFYHVSGEDGFTEPIDRCPEHLNEGLERPYPVTEDESHMLRRQVKAAAQRRLIAEQNKIAAPTDTGTTESTKA